MMIDIVLTLVFSIVMLVFMAFPAMKIVDWIETKVHIPEKWHNPLLLSMVVMLSLFIGLFLKFA
ncbi:hypothetical protein MNB_SV-10-722 [hydrothermal vent metagenome]|uniref:Uncharacterized protein n=1 Tax=hydrothermal vent metagenome TaxID=652676 RepID=A0A1W1CH65_9ZZZZ